MVDIAKIRQGLEVYGDDNQLLGKVERIDGQQIIVNGQAYPLSAFSRFEKNRLYFSGGQLSDTDFQGGQSEIKVPVYEEQLNVGKRQVELGEVEVQKTVTQEQVNIPVELRREEVNVQEIDIPDRQVQPGESTFQEGTIRVPVRAEEALVNKQAVVTREVVINKGVVAEQQQIADTVRKEQVTVDKNFTQNQGRVTSTVDNTAQVESYSQNSAATVQSDTPVSSDVTTATGTTTFDQSQIQEDMEVYSSDNEHLGKVKDVTGSYFLVGRGLFKSDIEASYTSVQAVVDDTVILNLTKEQVDALT